MNIYEVIESTKQMLMEHPEHGHSLVPHVELATMVSELERLQGSVEHNVDQATDSELRVINLEVKVKELTDNLERAVRDVILVTDKLTQIQKIIIK